MNWKQHIPTILLIAFFIVSYLAYNRLITSQAENRVLYERLEHQNKEMMQLHAEELKLLDSLKIIGAKRDSLIKKYDEQLRYIKGQNEVIYSHYKSISITLPNL